MNFAKVLLLVILAIGAVIFINSAYVIKETQQAVVLAFGKVQEVNGQPGLHFKTPFYEQVIMLDKRILETESKAEELQTVNKELIILNSFTKWRIVDAKKFYEKLYNRTRANDRIGSVVNSNVREIIAKITLEELISGSRGVVVGDVMRLSKPKIEGEYGIEIIDIRIKRADLPEENANYVYNDMKAERNKEAKELRAKGSQDSRVIKATAEKEAKVIVAEAKEKSEKLKGQGDAQAIKIYADAYSKDPRFYELSRTLESYKKSLASKDTTLVLDPSVKFLDPLQAGK
jgi:membrane protease subunit HflC|tara:strand:+ start:667 stop:1530 length:864 start_codon:yes stop_codon:yes gene_type:complete